MHPHRIRKLVQIVDLLPGEAFSGPAHHIGRNGMKSFERIGVAAVMIVVSSHGDGIQPAQAIQAGLGVGVVPDNVPYAGIPVHATRVRIRQHGFKCFPVAVNISKYRVFQRPTPPPDTMRTVNPRFHAQLKSR